MKITLIALCILSIQPLLADCNLQWPDCGKYTPAKPADPDPKLTRESLGTFAGTWEGQLPPIPAEPLRADCVWSAHIRLVFGEHAAEVQYWDDNRWETLTSNASVEIMSTNAVVSVIRAPANREWVETWTFVLTKKDRCTLLATYVRLVNNFRLPPEGQSSKFGQIAAGELVQAVAASDARR